MPSSAVRYAETINGKLLRAASRLNIWSKVLNFLVSPYTIVDLREAFILFVNSHLSVICSAVSAIDRSAHVQARAVPGRRKLQAAKTETQC